MVGFFFIWVKWFSAIFLQVKWFRWRCIEVAFLTFFFFLFSLFIIIRLKYISFGCIDCFITFTSWFRCVDIRLHIHYIRLHIHTHVYISRMASSNRIIVYMDYYSLSNGKQFVLIKKSLSALCLLGWFVCVCVCSVWWTYRMSVSYNRQSMNDECASIDAYILGDILTVCF